MVSGNGVDDIVGVRVDDGIGVTDGDIDKITDGVGDNVGLFIAVIEFVLGDVLGDIKLVVYPMLCFAGDKDGDTLLLGDRMGDIGDK